MILAAIKIILGVYLAMAAAVFLAMLCLGLRNADWSLAKFSPVLGIFWPVTIYVFSLADID